MRGLENFKVPNFKFPKLKMEGIKEEIKAEPILPKKQIKYEPYDFKTIKEVFEKSTEKFSEKEFLLEKFDHKGLYKEITYKEFREDVIGLGTGLIKTLNLKDKRVVIIGETTYQWYSIK